AAFGHGQCPAHAAPGGADVQRDREHELGGSRRDVGAGRPQAEIPRPTMMRPLIELMGTSGRAETIAAPGRRYLPALDGLRGTAILAVLLCHYSALLPAKRAGVLAGVLENGWAGVDLFFVISGFLI